MYISIYWLRTLVFVLTFEAAKLSFINAAGYLPSLADRFGFFCRNPEESAATFDEIPCWTPLADALLATLWADDDVTSFGQKDDKTKHNKKTQQKGGRCVFFGIVYF